MSKLSLFYVLSFFKKVEIIQGGILIREYGTSSISSQSNNHFFSMKFQSIDFLSNSFIVFLRLFWIPHSFLRSVLMSARVIEPIVIILFQKFSTVNFTLKQKWFFKNFSKSLFLKPPNIDCLAIERIWNNGLYYPYLHTTQ